MEHMNNIDGFVHSTLKRRPLRNPQKSGSTCRRAGGDQVSFAIYTVHHCTIIRTCHRWHENDRYGSRFMVGISSHRITLTHSQTVKTTTKCLTVRKSNGENAEKNGENVLKDRLMENVTVRTINNIIMIGGVLGPYYAMF